MAALRDNPRRVLLIGLVILVLICLVGVLIFRIFTTGGEEIGGGNTPTPPQATTQEPTPTPTPAETTEPTATATQVVAETPATVISLSNQTPTPKPTTPAPTATPTRPAATTQPQVLVQVKPGPAKNLLQNGDFEQGFDAGGVAIG